MNRDHIPIPFALAHNQHRANETAIRMRQNYTQQRNAGSVGGSSFTLRLRPDRSCRFSCRKFRNINSRNIANFFRETSRWHVIRFVVRVSVGAVRSGRFVFLLFFWFSSDRVHLLAGCIRAVWPACVCVHLFRSSKCQRPRERYLACGCDRKVYKKNYCVERLTFVFVSWKSVVFEFSESFALI